MTEQAPLYPQHLTGVPYAIEHQLQTLDICLPRPLSKSEPKETVWVVFIHGGAWRDPEQTSEELIPALDQILSNSSSKVTLDRIAGFASLNYGLSTYSPDSEEGQNDPALSVKHPTHILDILAALAFLQKNYSMGGIDISGGYRALREGQYNWISVGHSCGATLAFQICMADAETWSSSFVRSDPFITAHPTPERIKPPIAVVGLEGIYSLPLLHENHKDEPFYDFFMASAFGSGIEKWREVSPAYAGYKRASLDGGLEVVVLGHSNEDELVEWEQAIRMRRSLEDQGWKNLDDEEEKRGDGEKTRSEESRKELMMLKLEGKHDEIWSGGKGVRTSIEAAINRLFEQ